MRKIVLIVSALVIMITVVMAFAMPVPAIGLYWKEAVDPTAGGGVAAPLNQLLIRTDSPSIYYKSGSANTAWTKLGDGSSSGTVGPGTVNTLSKFTAANAVGNATGVTQTVNGTLAIGGAAGTDSLTVVTQDQAAVQGSRSVVGNTVGGRAVLYGVDNGSYNTTAGELFTYGVRGETVATRSAGANVLDGWGVFGRAASAQKNIGVIGWATASGVGVASDDAGVLGLSDSIATVAYGVRGNARGGAGTNYGGYFTATAGTTNYAGWMDGRTVVDSASNFTGLTVQNIKTTQTSSFALQSIDGSAATWDVTGANRNATGLDINMRTACVTGCAPNAMYSVGLSVKANASGYGTNGRTAIYATTSSGSPPTTGTDNYALYTDVGDVRLEGAITNTNGFLSTGAVQGNTMASTNGMTCDSDGSVGAAAFVIGASKFVVNSANGNTSIAGTLDVTGAISENGSRVFSNAGNGLTSTGATVNVVATANGGLTVNANDVQMTFCGANQIPKMNAGATQWTCAADGGGITNSAGNNVIMKSDGTNAVASGLTDNGTTVSTTEAISAGAVTSSATVTGVFLSGDVAGTSPTVNTCGTTPTQPTASDTNQVGTFSTGSGAGGTSCVLAFAGTAPNAPKCLAIQNGSNTATTVFLGGAGSCTTTQCTFNGLTASTAYLYWCFR